MPEYHCVLDASSLLKKYRQETGSDIVQALFKHKRCAIHILNITIPEVTGAFVRWRLINEINPKQREELKDIFIEDIRQYKVVVHNVTHRDIVRTDEVWTSSITPKPDKLPDDTLELTCPDCGRALEHRIQKWKPRVGPVDVLVLSVCVALRTSYGQAYLFSSDGHMLKVARKLNIKAYDPEAITNLPF